jgi:amino acid transporter
MKAFITAGATGRFLGFFRTLINAAFAYGGIEQLAMAAGEVENPTKTVPKAVRQVFWRIALFYVLGSLAVGILVPSDNQNLLTGTGIAKSPWIIAIQTAGIPALPSIINVVIITSASSAANAQIYTGSRYLYALAVHGQAPKIFLKVTERGVPIYCVGITSSIGLLSYMTVSSSGAQVFSWFSNLVAIAYLITWSAICFIYIRFRKAMDYNQIDPATQDFRAPFQPYLAWFGLVFFSIVILFNGFPVFTHGSWNVENFVTAYIGLP